MLFAPDNPHKAIVDVPRSRRRQYRAGRGKLSPLAELTPEFVRDRVDAAMDKAVAARGIELVLDPEAVRMFLEKFPRPQMPRHRRQCVGNRQEGKCCSPCGS